MILLVVLSNIIAQQEQFPVLRGPYLGQELPDTIPQLFAPGIISNGLVNRDVAISIDGKEMYFGIHTADFSYSTIIVTRQKNGVWTRPQVVSFANNPDYIYLEPALSFDEKRLFFLSNLPKDSTKNPGDEDIWVVDREGQEWGQPYNLGAPVNTPAREFFPSLTNDGMLYFTRAEQGERLHHIYRSRYVDGRYQTPEKLPEQVNCGTNRFNASIAPDESFIIVPAVGIKGALGGVDYYLVNRHIDDTWAEPVNMGPLFNSPSGAEWSFYISPDARYCFFMATRQPNMEHRPKVLTIDFFNNFVTEPQNGNADIYWIDAKVLKNYR
jgi:hypothetical protein